MKLAEIKKILDNKYNVKDIKNIIKKITPADLHLGLNKKDDGENLIIKIIKSKLV